MPMLDHANGKTSGLNELSKENKVSPDQAAEHEAKQKNRGTQQMALFTGPRHDREFSRDCQIHFDETREAPILLFSSLSHCHSLDES